MGDEPTVIYSAKVNQLKEMAEDAIINKEYRKALTYYRTANMYIKNQEFQFDLQIVYLQRILQCMYRNENLLIQMLEHYKELALINRDEDLFTLVEKHYIAIAKPFIRETLKELNDMIPMQMSSAVSKTLCLLEEKDVLKRYSPLISYLRAKNIETCMNQNRLLPDKNKTAKLIDKIRLSYKNKQYDQMIKYSVKGIEQTNHPVFLYYIGKAYFKKKEYEKALEYLLQYNKLGVDKYPVACLYLYRIYQYIGKMDRSAQVLKDVMEVETFFSDFSFEYRENYNLYKSSKVARSDYYDSKPNKILKKVKMKEKDFIKRNE